MIKSELNNRCAKSGVINMYTPSQVDGMSGFDKKNIIPLFWSNTILTLKNLRGQNDTPKVFLE